MIEIFFEQKLTLSQKRPYSKEIYSIVSILNRKITSFPIVSCILAILYLNYNLNYTTTFSNGTNPKNIYLNVI